MRIRVIANRLATAAVLLSGAAVAAFLLFGDANHELSDLVGIEVGFVTWPVGLCVGLMTIGRLCLWLSNSELAAHVSVRRSHESAAIPMRLADVLVGIHRLLTDVGWAALVLGLLSSVTEWPGLQVNHQAAAESVAPAHYLGGLESFVAWSALLLATFITARAVATVRPEVGTIVGWPVMPLAGFGIAYGLLADNGALAAAFGLDGTLPLLGFALMAALAWAASAIGRALVIWPDRRSRSLRWLRAISETAWPLALFGAVVALASEAERVSTQTRFTGPGSVDASYLEVLHSHTLIESLALFIPFALINYVRARGPSVASVVGAPSRHLALIAIAYILFADSGVIATAFAVEFPWMLRALVGATALVYAASTLRNVANLRVRRSYLKLALNGLQALSAAASAAAPAAVVLATLHYLPAAGVELLELPATRSFWEGLLPLVAGLYEARLAIAGSLFITTAMLLLIRSMSGQISLRVEALMSAVSYLVAGCLIWIIATDLAENGHGFTFVGAVGAAGMFSLALSRLASSLAASSSPALADIAGWLSASWVRAFILGAAAMFYVLLLRPVVYAQVGLAALYEYIALLALLLAVLFSVVNRLRVVASPDEAVDRGGDSWRRHQQALEHKDDTRAALPDAMRQQYLEHGDWRPLWVYLLALLYRSETSVATIVTVCETLRRGAGTPLASVTLSHSRKRRARSTVLKLALDTAGQALADSPAQRERLSEDGIRGLGASYIENGADPVPLVVALIVAQCQRGDRPEDAVERWFYLLDTSNPVLDWLKPRWGRLAGKPRSAAQRQNLVNEAIASFSDKAPQDRRIPPRDRFAGDTVGSRP